MTDTTISLIEKLKAASYDDMECAEDRKILNLEEVIAIVRNHTAGHVATQGDVEAWLTQHYKYLACPLTGGERIIIRDVLAAIAAMGAAPETLETACANEKTIGCKTENLSRAQGVCSEIMIAAGDVLPGDENFPDGLVAVPIEQMEDIYARFKRLTKMGQAKIEEWDAMPKDVAELRRAVFGEADMGAVFAGNWVQRRRG